MVHFSNNEDQLLAGDRLRKVSPVINKLLHRYQEVYTPGLNICIDETMVPFRGRLRFRQYIKNKKHKFGIKVYKLCCESGYTYNIKVYCGTDASDGGQASRNVVFHLMEGLLDSGRQLFTDNYYTSISLASELLSRSTHLIGTLRSNRKYNPRDVIEKKLKPKEIYAKESDTGIVVLKWFDKRDVLMLSTVHRDNMKKINQRGGETEKPLAIIDYNKAKAYIDLSDQIKSYSHCLRRGTKWYRKLAFEIILGSTVVNAHIVYKQVTQDEISVTEFREKLCLSLLGILQEPNATGHVRNETDNNHILQETSSRLRCVVCYRKMKEEEGRKKALNKTSRTKFQCTECKKYYCIQCFFVDHYSHLK